MKFSISSAIVLTSLSTLVHAQTTRDLDSHEHGSAVLNVAIDNDVLFLELETPWNNIVGFEHAPNTEEQHERVDNALELLNSPENLFALSGGNCTVNESSVESTMEHEEHEEHEEHDDHKEHEEHEEHAEHEEHKEHEEHEEHADHSGHSDEESTHSTVLAQYSYQCDDIKALSSIDVGIFELWPDFETIDAQLIGPTGQTIATINSGNSQVDLTSVQ